MSKYFFLFVTVLLHFGCSNPAELKDHGVVEPYHPKQKIDFPHDIHTGKNGIDCKYCHNSATTGKDSELPLPSKDVCLNCHKTVSGNTPDTIQAHTD